MPRKRVHTKQRLDVLTLDQRGHLCCGVAFFGDNDFPFDDEAHREALWREHRDELLAEYLAGQRPGSRPDAYWCYDAPAVFEAAENEVAAILALSDVTEAERAAIEAACRQRVRVALINGSSTAAARSLAAQAGLPGALFDALLPDALVEQEAERAAWRIICGRRADA